MHPIPTDIRLTAQHSWLLQGKPQGQAIETGTRHRLGYGQQRSGRKADDDARTHTAVDLDAVARSRNKEAGGTENITLTINLKAVDTGNIRKHQLGLTPLLHLPMDGRAQGGKQGEITEAKTTGMVDEGLITIGMIPAVNMEGQKGSHHSTKINGVGRSQRSARQLDEWKWSSASGLPGNHG